MELVVFVFTQLFIRFQTGSVGTLSSDRVVIEPNALRGIALPGPKGTYTLDRFSALRVEFRSGPRAAGRSGWWAERTGVAGRQARDAGHRARADRGRSRPYGGAGIRRAPQAACPWKRWGRRKRGRRKPKRPS